MILEFFYFLAEFSELRPLPFRRMIASLRYRVIGIMPAFIGTVALILAPGLERLLAIRTVLVYKLIHTVM